MALNIICISEFHQGNEIFSDFSRGKQCVANCFVFLIMFFQGHISPIQTCCESIMNQILQIGDVLYVRIANGIIHENRFLHPSDIPCHLKFVKDVIHIRTYSTFSGLLCPHFQPNRPFFSLEESFANICNNDIYKCMIFVSVEFATGIIYNSSRFFFFF